jgi:hypothetical protein
LVRGSCSQSGERVIVVVRRSFSSDLILLRAKFTFAAVIVVTAGFPPIS